MLSTFQKNTSSWFAKILLAILIFIFAFFGFGNFNFNSQETKPYAKVNGESILAVDFYREYQQREYILRQRKQGTSITDSERKTLRSETLDSLINQKLLLQHAHENGFSVTEEELGQKIRETHSFQTDHIFDKEKYKEVLKNENLSISKYEEKQKDSLLLRKYFQFLQSLISISERSIETSIIQSNTEIQLEVLSLNPENFIQQNNTPITEEELKDYYQRNLESFRQKEQYSIQYISLDTKDVSKNTKVRKKEIDRYYEQNKYNEFTQEEILNIRQVSFYPTKETPQEKELTQKKIDSFYQEVSKQPNQFQNIAKKYLKNEAQQIIPYKKGSLPQIDTFLSSLKPGEISQPIPTQFATIIIKLESILPAKTFSLKEVETVIQQKILDKKNQRKLNRIKKEIDEEILEPSFTLENLATQQNKTVQTSKSIDGTQYIQPIGNTLKLYQDIENREIGEIATFQVQNGSFIVYQLSKKIDSFIKPFGEVEELVKLQAEEEKKNNQITKQWNELSENTTTKEQFDTLSKKFKLKPISIEYKYRDQIIPELGYDPQFHKTVFNMKDDEVITSIHSQNKYYIVQKIKKIPGKVDISEQQLKIAQEQLKLQKQNLLIERIPQQMREEAKIEYFEVNELNNTQS